MLTVMRTKTIPGAMVAATALLMLAGCAAPSAGPAAAEPSATPLPTRSTPPNMNACATFGVLVNSIPDVANADGAMDQWEGLAADFDRVALTATGVTQDRMLAFVADWPDAVDVILWNKLDSLNASIESVQRACTADGNTTTFATLTTS